jgi:hypothetical protein
MLNITFYGYEGKNYKKNKYILFCINKKNKIIINCNSKMYYLIIYTKNKCKINNKLINKNKIKLSLKVGENIEIDLMEIFDDIKMNKIEIKYQKIVDNKIVDNKIVDNKIVDNNNYYSEIIKFSKIYNCSIDDVKTNKKIEFRYLCFKYLNYISKLQLPEIKLNLKNEAVLIEYRQFPHIEFLLRNNIKKLGINWSHTIICGILNYNFILNIVNKISKNIKVIKTKYENLNQSTYSKFMASIEFWNLFTGEKILIYQEDSIIFKFNINDFIEWDYIGAPWPKDQNDNPNCVGNGGFSLRTKQCMIDVINKISLENTPFESSTNNYIKACGMILGPEDVYFSLNMIRYKIGKVADWDTAYKFSSESFANSNSLGGHNFWINDINWKNRIYNDIIVQFKPTYKTDDLEHRGGWKSVIENLKENNLFNNESEFIFFDLVERYFLWDQNYMCNNKWAGIIHCTQSTPSYLEIANISNLFKNINFINSLDNCVFLISLSNYVSEYLNCEFIKLGKNIKIYTLYHPVYKDDSIPKFSLEKFKINSSKYLIQIGQQLRKMTSIYLVNINKSYNKMWLTGTKNISKCLDLLKKEVKYLNVKIKKFNTVEMKYTETFEEYDELLSKNIVLVDLFDASANNTVLECIVRNTPILINKLPAVVEYLGEDYPLYFNNLNEINNLLSDKNIAKAYEYLNQMDKKKFDLNYFTSEIVSIINIHINEINDKSINKKNIECIVSNNQNISALIIKKNKEYEIIECDNKNEIERSICVFENIKNIIIEYNLNIYEDKVIYHYKSDSCDYKGQLLPILSHSKKISNNNVILWSLTKNQSYIHWNLQEYIKSLDMIKWENKKNIFFFRGLNSGNPFDCVEYPWFINRSSRTKLLLESLKLSIELKELCDISFYTLENYDEILKYVNNTNKLNELFGNLLKKDKTIIDLQKEIKIMLNYIKPNIELNKIYENKFIFCPEGFDVSAQLSWVLASNSVAICPPFQYESNIINSNKLKPYIHYIPINADYSNLNDVMEWCLTHDNECKKINDNAKKYMEDFLDEEKMKEYHKDILLKII